MAHLKGLCATEVIKEGSYLEKDFEFHRLTVAQLLGIFNYHDVQYPTKFTKAVLCMLFKKEIRDKAHKLKRERNQNTVANNEGIVDGLTGIPVNLKEKVRTIKRLQGHTSLAPPSGPFCL
jgi:hypothetical protein